MNLFGTRLRQLRQISLTEKGEKITQQKLGDLLSLELRPRNFSNVTISNWENGNTNINKDDRLVLLTLLAIFLGFNALKSIDECNEFLVIGNFRCLNEEEILQLNLDSCQNSLIEQPNLSMEKENKLLEDKWPYNFSQDIYYRLPSWEKLIDDLIDVILNSPGKKVINICGIGGIGKTAFALEIARRLIQQGSFSRLIGESANDRILVGNEVMRLRFEEFSFPELWDSLAIQLDRNDLIGQNVYVVAKELLTQFHDEKILCLADGIELMKKHRVFYISNRVNLGNIRLIITSRIIKSHLDFINITLNSMSVEDTKFFLEKEAINTRKDRYLPLLCKNIDRIMDVSGGIPIIIQYIFDRISFLNLDSTLKEITNGHSPLFELIFSNEWQQLDENCCKYLINRAKEIKRQEANPYLYHFNSDCNQVEMKYFQQAYLKGFLERHKIDGKYQYYLNSFTRHFLNYQEKSNP